MARIRPNTATGIQKSETDEFNKQVDAALTQLETIVQQMNSTPTNAQVVNAVKFEAQVLIRLVKFARHIKNN